MTATPNLQTRSLCVILGRLQEQHQKWKKTATVDEDLSRGGGEGEVPVNLGDVGLQARSGDVRSWETDSFRPYLPGYCDV